MPLLGSRAQTTHSDQHILAESCNHPPTHTTFSFFPSLFTQMIARRVWMTASTAVRGRRNASTVAIQDLKTRWPSMSTTEQNTIAKELEEVQKQDWKVMSTEDKKAACKSLYEMIFFLIANDLLFRLYRFW